MEIEHKTYNKVGDILHGLKIAVNNLDLLTDGLYVFDQDCGNAFWFY